MDLDINHSLEILKEEDEEKDRRYRIVAVDVDKGNNSEYVFHWALNHLVSHGESLVLIHVRQPILTIPTPSMISSSCFNILYGGWRVPNICRCVGRFFFTEYLHRAFRSWCLRTISPIDMEILQHLVLMGRITK